MSDKCPKCNRPWRPRAILLSDMDLYCRQTDDRACLLVQRDVLQAKLDSMKAGERA